LAFWGSHQHADSSGIDLLADHSCHNLNNTGTQGPNGEPASSNPDGSTLDQAGQGLTPVPPLLETSPTTAGEPVDTRLETVVPALPPMPPATAGFGNAYTTTHQGDSPMMRNWKMLGLHTFVAAVFGGVAFADPEKTSGDSKKLDEIQTQLKKLEDVPTRLKNIETSTGALSTIQAELKDLRKDFENGTALAAEKFKGLDQRIAALEEAVKKAPDKKPDARIALSPPEPTAAGNGEMKRISESLESIVAELKGMRTDLNAGAAGNQAQLRGLNEKIASLEKAMTAMRDQIKFYQPAPAPAPTPGTGTTITDKLPLVGRIRLRNDFVNPVSVVVNGKSYRLDPGQSDTLNNIPAGPFSFEIIGIQGRKQETLAANETYTITVFTR
jgi:hypothetical protein